MDGSDRLIGKQLDWYRRMDISIYLTNLLNSNIYNLQVYTRIVDNLEINFHSYCTLVIFAFSCVRLTEKK